LEIGELFYDNLWTESGKRAQHFSAPRFRVVRACHRIHLLASYTFIGYFVVAGLSTAVTSVEAYAGSIGWRHTESKNYELSLAT
jgi:hypothetical protein